MNAANLSNHISGSPEQIIKVLEAMDFTNISYNAATNKVRFAREAGRNPSSSVIDVPSLQFFCFSTNTKGNLFTLVMDKMGFSFPKALTFVANIVGFKDSANFRISYPFGGFYKNLIKEPEQPSEDIKTYPMSTLDQYERCVNLQFLKDGIDLKTQEIFKLGIDRESNRISIPEFTISGELCGIMGRSLDPKCKHEERWLPLIPCSRAKTLYGYHLNYKRIIEKQTLILFESEKAVMQCWSFGSNVALSTCGCRIHDFQVSHIRSLMIPKIIIAFDEGLEEEFVREEAKKVLENNSIIHNKVGYIWDADGDIIPRGSKNNAADLGKARYAELLKTKVRWLS